jgi:hypothetical protein
LKSIRSSRCRTSRAVRASIACSHSLKLRLFS